MLNKENKTRLLQLILFLATLYTTTLAGVSHENLEWVKAAKAEDEWGMFLAGLYFSIPFLTILTAHEFGHYFTARWYKMKVTLPYYIPLPIFSIIGTLGAVIRLKSPTRSTKQFFDVGIAGPLAGFVLALGLTWYGYTHLPPREAIYNIHPDYEQFDEGSREYKDYVYEHEYMLDRKYASYLEMVKRDSLKFIKAHPDKEFINKKEFNSDVSMLVLGSNLIFDFFETYVVEDKSRIPNEYEMIHNPYLMAAFIAFLFTAINLMPIGQLDGGHVLYGLLGYEKHKLVSKIFFIAFVFYAGLGMIDLTADDAWLYQALYGIYLYFILNKAFKDRSQLIILCLSIILLQIVFHKYLGWEGYAPWLVFALFIGRFAGVEHPRAMLEQKLDKKRQVLGWFALLVFVLCLSPAPLSIV